jgi:hypothetical protein
LGLTVNVSPRITIFSKVKNINKYLLEHMQKPQ